MANKLTFTGIVTDIQAFVDEETGNKALRYFAKNETEEENAYVRFNDSIVKYGEFEGKDWTAKELARYAKLFDCAASFEAIAPEIKRAMNTEVEIAYGERDDPENPGQKLETKRITFTGLGEKPASQAVELSAWAKA